MLFNRLLNKTRQVLGKKPAPPENLPELAREHNALDVRRDAVRRLASLPQLRDILTSDSDAGVRELAATRYRHLLAGTEQAGLTVEERLTEFAGVADLRVVESLAREGHDAPLRRAAIARVANPAVLVDCALHDPTAANRGAAVARLDDRVGLEQVARQIGKKDKAVYRAVREKLRQQAEQEAAPQRINALCADLCERAERLGHLQQWTQDRALLGHLDRQWAEAAPQAQPELQVRYAAARACFIAAHDAYQAANAAQLATKETLIALAARREALIAQAAGLAALDAAAQLEVGARLTADWAALGAAPDAEQRDQERRFNQHLQSVAAAGQAPPSRSGARSGSVAAASLKDPFRVIAWSTRRRASVRSPRRQA